MEGDNISAENRDSSSLGSKLKKGMLDTATNINETLQYVKAFFVAQVKKLGAKSEQELAEADLQEEKMQVEATDAAEAEKKHHEQQVLGINS